MMALLILLVLVVVVGTARDLLLAGQGEEACAPNPDILKTSGTGRGAGPPETRKESRA
jgi:hypothetical protein